MTTLEDIQNAVAALPADQLAKFRVWFDEFDAARFDARTEQDIAAGRLDRLAREAVEEFHANKARP
jgi:hypothetical protein